MKELRALPVNAAILDASGTIVAVNDTWKDFARQNGLRLPNFGVGSNYLQFCESDGLYPSLSAADLKDLLVGQKKLLTLIYPCDSPAIDWRFRVGDKVKIRLLNEMAGDHPMHHPFHVHGAGRFLILGRDGVAEENLVWKDTVLVRTGETVDILLDVTNVGLWMAHCHIAEHHESGMMFSFNVTP